MADGEGKDVYDVLMKLSNQVSRVETKVDGLVSHERMAEVINVSRTEWRNDIQKALEDLADKMRSERKAEMSDLESKVKADGERRVEKMESRLATQEERDSKREGQVQRQQIAMGGMVIVILVYAVVQALGGH